MVAGSLPGTILPPSRHLDKLFFNKKTVHRHIAPPAKKVIYVLKISRDSVDRAGKSDSLAWFRENLKRARKAKGYSQEMLCEIAGIDLSHYGAVERGERTITIQKLFQITRALDIPMRQLFSGEPGRPADEKEDRLERLIELLRGLDAGDLELFHEILPRLVKWKGGK